MALPPKYTLGLYAGDDRDFIVRYKDDKGVAIDLTGFTAKMQLKQDPCGAVALEIVGVIAAPQTGEIIFPFTGAETQGLIIDCLTTCYLYDVELTQPSAGILTILRGVVRVEEDITE